MILYMVEYGNAHVICTARSHQHAKANAYKVIGADPDEYIVTPLTSPGDRIFLDITVQV